MIAGYNKQHILMYFSDIGSCRCAPFAQLPYSPQATNNLLALEKGTSAMRPHGFHLRQELMIIFDHLSISSLYWLLEYPLVPPL
jgi:hypothetical protein